MMIPDYKPLYIIYYIDVFEFDNGARYTTSCGIIPVFAKYCYRIKVTLK